MSLRSVLRSGGLLGAAVGLVVPIAALAATSSQTFVPELGGGPGRTFFNADETAVNASTVNQLVPKWRFPTVEPVTASPAVTTVKVNGVDTRVAYDADFAGNLYAINAGSGLPVWEQCLVVAPAIQVPADEPGAGTIPTTGSQPPAPLCALAYPYNGGNQVDYGVAVDSPAVATVGSRSVVYEGADATMSALDAATGSMVWTFNTAGDSGVGNYEIEGSPNVVTTPSGEQIVLFSIDCNGYCAKPGGIYAVDAADGHLVWFFDTAAGAAFQPSNTTTRSFAPTDTGPASAGAGACGGVWTSPTVDLSLGLVFASTADCPEDPLTSAYYEAAFALELTSGSPVWTYQPRTLDGQDLDYSATANLFRIGSTDVVGFGSKDGTYTVINAAPVTGCVAPTAPSVAECSTPVWRDKLTVGGNFGGFYNGTTDGKRIYLTSAIGTLSGNALSPTDTSGSATSRVWALDAGTGAIDWVTPLGAPTLGQNMAVPGVYFDSGLDHAVHAYDTSSGMPLDVIPVGGAVSSTPVVTGGELFVGANTGATFRSAVGTCADPTGLTCKALPPVPTTIPVYEDGGAVLAYCLASDPACQLSRTSGIVPGT